MSPSSYPDGPGRPKDLARIEQCFSAGWHRITLLRLSARFFGRQGSIGMTRRGPFGGQRGRISPVENQISVDRRFSSPLHRDRRRCHTRLVRPVYRISPVIVGISGHGGCVGDAHHLMGARRGAGVGVGVGAGVATPLLWYASAIAAFTFNSGISIPLVGSYTQVALSRMICIV